MNVDCVLALPLEAEYQSSGRCKVKLTEEECKKMPGYMYSMQSERPKGCYVGGGYMGFPAMFNRGNGGDCTKRYPCLCKRPGKLSCSRLTVRNVSQFVLHA